MIKAPYDRNREYDIIYEKVISRVGERIQKDGNDDDFLLLYAGLPGTGKSNLMLHGYELYDPEGCHVDFIGLDRQSHAKSLKDAKEKTGRRFCADDEADTSSREAMTRYNRHKISLYMAIRGLNIFHAWCNPSIHMLEKTFIEERIKGLIVVATKDKDRPRIYYYFRRKDILNLLEKEKNLKLRTVLKHAKKYAYYKGWFRAYKGKLLEPYMEKKNARMDFKVDEYFDNYSENEDLLWCKTDFARKLSMHYNTVHKRFNLLKASGKLVEGEHYIISGSGKVMFKEEAIPVISS